MYVKPKIACQEIGVNIQTLRNWAKDGRIKYITGGKGGRLYDTKSLTNAADSNKKKYIYCRVSCSKQKDDLTRQINFLKEKYKEHIVIYDIASGINFKRKALQRLLDESINGNISEIVVAHKDRMCRISWDHFQWLFKRLGVNIIVEDREEHSPESELADDLFSIIHVFSCRHYGQRRNYTNKGISEIKSEEETDS